MDALKLSISGTTKKQDTGEYSDFTLTLQEDPETKTFDVTWSEDIFDTETEYSGPSFTDAMAKFKELFETLMKGVLV